MGFHECGVRAEGVDPSVREGLPTEPGQCLKSAPLVAGMEISCCCASLVTEPLGPGLTGLSARATGQSGVFVGELSGFGEVLFHLVKAEHPGSIAASGM
ncbi:hypothetical protein [Leifsonia sp. NPDC058248]|uniref:hypothetical protein n=1 Tax=Leifsonia sp. NPDC058248 TaxID=3346402 RepID=UPI0036D795FB